MAAFPAEVAEEAVVEEVERGDRKKAFSGKDSYCLWPQTSRENYSAV